MSEITDKQLDQIAQRYISRTKLHHHAVLEGVYVMVSYHHDAGRTLAAETKRERLNGMEYMLTELVRRFEFAGMGDDDADPLRTYSSAIVNRLVEYAIKNHQDAD